mmetsp:Transcript_78697/g.190622  ORF Transcript_78697/g.190622 Transcript_78697/m.190622 type:complete len:336 (-) Transcript_78697:125-1132(-)
MLSLQRARAHTHRQPPTQHADTSGTGNTPSFLLSSTDSVRVILRAVADRDERVPDQRRAADEEPVDVLLLGQLFAVARVDAAAVLNPHLRRDVLGHRGRHERADPRVRLLRLLRRRDLPGADRPHRLVRDDDLLPIARGELVHDRLELPAADVLRRAALALLERLADARHDGEPVLDGVRHLLADELVALAAQRAAFGVPQNDPRHVRVRQHLRAHLAGERAAFAHPAVLRGELELAVDRALDLGQVQHRRGDDHVHVRVDLALVQVLHELRDGRGVPVALPVSADDEFARARHRRDAAGGRAARGARAADGGRERRGRVSLDIARQRARSLDAP